MNGKTLSSKLRGILTAAVILATCLSGSAQATDTDTIQYPDSMTIIEKNLSELKYERRLQRREEFWHKLIPEMVSVQYAGGIGMISAGFGWAYGCGDRWETHLMLGFLPKRYNYHHYWTFTLREYFNPWKIRFKQHWQVTPLSVNLSINSLLHSDFWMKEPSRYPDGYYGFSSRIRFHLGLGQRISFLIPREKRFMSRKVSLYYEVSTCDLYLRQKFLNSSIPLKDIITLGIGAIFTI